MNKSGTVNIIDPPTSSTSIEAYFAYLDVVQSLNKPKTVNQIKIEGEIRIKVGVMWVIGTATGILSFFGMLSFFMRPDISKDIWVIIGPIITAGLTGLIVAFLTGEKVSKNK